MAQYGLDLGARDHVRLLATAYGARASLAGVVREDDVHAGRIAYDGSYANFGQGQGVQSSRVILGADLEHDAPGGARLAISPWVMWTGFRARQNFTGDLESSQINPAADASALSSSTSPSLSNKYRGATKNYSTSMSAGITHAGRGLAAYEYTGCHCITNV